MKNTDTAETLASEIIECWINQASDDHVMNVGTADDMGIYADLQECPAELHEEIVALVREGFENFNTSRGY